VVSSQFCLHLLAPKPNAKGFAARRDLISALVRARVRGSYFAHILQEPVERAFPGSTSVESGVDRSKLSVAVAATEREAALKTLEQPE